MATKTVNYTPEQTAAMLAAYVAHPSADVVAQLAAEMGKTVRSVVAKLSREGVYVAKTYTTKSGETPVKKDELADRMAEAFGLTESEADSLTKANKTALMKILDKVATLQAE